MLSWNHFGPHALPLEPQEQQDGVAGNNPSEWQQSVLMTDDRQLYLLPTYFFRCFCEGGRFIKQGRSNLAKLVGCTLRVQSQPILIEGRFVPHKPEYISDGVFLENTPDVFVDTRGVVNPTTRKRNVRYRIATVAGWVCQLEIHFDRTIISRTQMHSVCHQAGEFVGLGDGRQMGLGRFVVESFESPDSS